MTPLLLLTCIARMTRGPRTRGVPGVWVRSRPGWGKLVNQLWSLSFILGPLYGLSGQQRNVVQLCTRGVGGRAGEGILSTEIQKCNYTWEAWGWCRARRNQNGGTLHQAAEQILQRFLGQHNVWYFLIFGDSDQISLLRINMALQRQSRPHVWRLFVKYLISQRYVSRP